MRIRKEDLLFDSWNIRHIGHHRIERHEVEEICSSVAFIEKGNKDRLVMIGSTNENRVLTIILSLDKSKYYVVTAYQSTNKQVKLYQDNLR